MKHKPKILFDDVIRVQFVYRRFHATLLTKYKNVTCLKFRECDPFSHSQGLSRLRLYRCSLVADVLCTTLRFYIIEAKDLIP